MTPKERAAMQQALEALGCYNSKHRHTYCLDGSWDEEITKGEKAITALREALEQPDEIDWIETNKSLAKEIIDLKKQAEQEPVAWFVQYKNRHEFVFGSKPEFIVDGVVEPLYAAPVRTKDLTDDEIMKINVDTAGIVPTCDRQFHFARAVIAAYKEKNK